MSEITLKVLLSVDTDLNALWAKIVRYKGTSLSGEDAYYVVNYSGTKGDAMQVLDECLKAGSSGKFYADFHA